MSFLMITYNQERYVAEALQSALSQDCPNLEIIICDDASRDRTYEIASEIAAAYRGHHRLVLHRNPRNLGIAANFYQAYTLSSGEWLFMAAGDDVSLPNRCAVVADGMARFPRALAFGTNYEIIDGAGRSLGYFDPRVPVGAGAVVCWQRCILADFPPLTSELKVEDYPLYTRVFALGGTFVKLPAVTVRYRVDGHSFLGQDRNTALTVKQYQLKMAGMYRRCLEQRLADLELVRQKRDVPGADGLAERQQWFIRDLELQRENCQEAIRAMTCGIPGQLRYLLASSSLPLHDHWWKRLLTVLRGQRLLIGLKRLFRRPTAGIALPPCVPSIPPDLPPCEVTVERYLADLACDYHHAVFLRPEAAQEPGHGSVRP
ncbi:MAG: glycosyltransferase [Lentisphaeria bacterium]|nr:glycosyltransferase [Lentisphaeria bacterium]